MSNKAKKILIVEDDAMMRNVIMGKLMERQCTVLEAEDGVQAVSICVREKPRLILLDLLLPKMDGYEVMERLRSNPDKAVALIPIIIFSNYDDSKHISKAQAFNVLDYYVKNKTNIDTLCDRVWQMLAEDQPVA